MHDARWTDDDLMQALERHEAKAHACPGCGHDARDAWLPSPPSRAEWQRMSDEERDAFRAAVAEVERRFTVESRHCAACQRQAEAGKPETGRLDFVARTDT